MTDLRARFGTLDDVQAPDLWNEATMRAAASSADPVPALSRFAVPMVVTAAVVVTALILGVVRPWQPDPGVPLPAPLSPASPSATPGDSSPDEPMVLRPETAMRSTYPPGDYVFPMSLFWMHDVTDFPTQVQMRIQGISYEPGPEAEPAVIAGFDGWVEQLPSGSDDALTEIWTFEVDGRPIMITITAQPMPSAQAELEEARGIVESIRVDPDSSEDRLIFTVPEGWDSA